MRIHRILRLFGLLLAGGFILVKGSAQDADPLPILLKALAFAEGFHETGC